MKIYYFFILCFLLFSACHTAEKAVVKPTEIEKVPDLAALKDSAYFYGKIAGKTVLLKENTDFNSSQTAFYFSPSDSGLFTRASIYPKDVIKSHLLVSVALYRHHRLKQSFSNFQQYFQVGKTAIRYYGYVPIENFNYEIFVNYTDDDKEQHSSSVYGEKTELEIMEVENLVYVRGVPDVRVKFRIKGSMWSNNPQYKGRYLGEIDGIYQTHFRYQYVDVDSFIKKLNDGK